MKITRFACNSGFWQTPQARRRLAAILKKDTFWTRRDCVTQESFGIPRTNLTFTFLLFFWVGTTWEYNNFNAKSFQDAQWWHQSGISSFVPIDPKFCCIYDLLSAYFSQIYYKAFCLFSIVWGCLCVVMQRSTPTKQITYFSSVYWSILSPLSVQIQGSVQHISSGGVKSCHFTQRRQIVHCCLITLGWTCWTSLTWNPPPIKKKPSSLGHLHTQKWNVWEFGNSKIPNFPRLWNPPRQEL